MARYLSGLCVASLGLCAGAWLIVTAVLLSGEPTKASLVSLSAGAGLAVVSAVGIACWSVAWRRPADGSVPVARPASPGGPVPASQARRRTRVLRRDMRRSARAARRQARRRDAASMGTIAYGGSAARRESPAQPAGGTQRANAAHGAGIEVARPAAATPEDPALLLLNEIRSLLEPLLAAAHDAAAPGTTQASMRATTPGTMPEKTPDERPVPPGVPAPSRTPPVAPREPPAPAPAPRPAGLAGLAGTCPLIFGDAEESW